MKSIKYLLLASCLGSLHTSLTFGDYSPKDLKQMEKKVQAAVKKAIPATVSVHPLNFSGAGSGVVVSEDGYVLTAAHVVMNRNKASLVFPDGKRVDADVLSRNPERDIALLKITDPGSYPYVEIGKSTSLKVTDIVIALGHPGGYDIRRSAPIRIGRVYTAPNDGHIVTDCTLIGGDSGGPLIDLDGKVIGIHSSIGGSLSNNNHAPVHAATDHWDDMKAGKDVLPPRFARNRNGSPDQPVLGVVLDGRNDIGIPINRVVDGSPADKAGIKVGDIMIGFDGNEISTYDDFFNRLNNKKPGEDVRLKVLRGNKELQKTVSLGRRGDIYSDVEPPSRPRARRPQFERPRQPKAEPAPSPQPAFLGLYFEDDRERPTVAEIVKNSGAAKAGLKPGDIILHADHKHIEVINDLRAVMSSAKAGDTLALEIERQGKKRTIDVTLGVVPDSLR